jgi:hypothetical protein
MDEIDRADLEALSFLEAAIAAARGNAAVVPPAGPATGRERPCATCGDTIPVARLRAVPATRLCCDCAGRRERTLGLHARPPARHTPAMPLGYDDAHAGDAPGDEVAAAGEALLARFTTPLGLR